MNLAIPGNNAQPRQGSPNQSPRLEMPLSGASNKSGSKPSQGNDRPNKI